MEISGTERTLSPPVPPRQSSPGANPQPVTDKTRLRDAENAAQVAAASAKETSKEDPGILEKLKAAVEKIQEFVSSTASDIKFSIDEQSGQTVVKVVDRETQDVIRQIPSQEMLDLAQALDKLQGLLIKQKA